ncbi:site-specific integrase [Paraburkholderia diazotrophica]|uniref:Phage integrase family protein n=1 Tax=Paraburkholderia diazotrophica TaxID=667676 RepID=A0A1H7EEP4_9BURK|nr:site-specific integrase [Paraburkholderia diazotrophica]SEK12423.1 Phage integrase family protein [Paraburkholderia diazotrophica]
MFQHLDGPDVPLSLRGPVLVDDSGLPRYWAAVWSTMWSPRLAASTHAKKLRHLENLYQHAARIGSRYALDDALGTLDDQALAEILESWFVSIRNQSAVTGADEKRWQTGLEFVSSVVTWLSKSEASNDRLRRIEQRLHRLAGLYSQLHVRRDNPVEMVRSLPACTVEALYLLLDPDSPQNPFARERTRWRVFVAFVLMLHQGLRRGEALLLPADAVKSAYDRRQQRMRHWLNVQENGYDDGDGDPRYSKPGIKNAHSVRQLPVSELTARVVQRYVENYRGRPSHSYLLNSQIDTPLSTESLTKTFALISRRLPSEVLAELKDRTGKHAITPHDLRHTSAVVRLHQLLEHGDAMDEALQKMRTFFGWSKTSTMPSRYARAVFEDRLAGVWNEAFDDRVALLRALPRQS